MQVLSQRNSKEHVRRYACRPSLIFSPFGVCAPISSRDSTSRRGGCRCVVLQKMRRWDSVGRHLTTAKNMKKGEVAEEERTLERRNKATITLVLQLTVRVS
ncbi:unnamed protein product [Lasius platythorax]|uniref:Uncharacterized protein n=1 Tax=Lasius platythorax TaxID=488582 RepID=A0AAV2NU81_9HYME